MFISRHRSAVASARRRVAVREASIGRIAIHTSEEARQRAHARAETPEFAVALRKRRKVEALFSELKNLIGLRRLRLRRIKFVREQFYLTAVALKRLVRFLNMRAKQRRQSHKKPTSPRKT